MKLGKAFGVAVAILFSLKVLEFVLKISQTGFVFHYAIGMISGIAIFLWWFIPAGEIN